MLWPLSSTSLHIEGMKMSSSLKEANKLPLYAVLMANLTLYYLVVKTDAIFGGQWLDLARSLPDAMPAGFGLVLAGILNAQLSPDAKARIVFLRWENALPGCEAFTRYAQSDPRINIAALESKFGPLPTEPRDQNSLWYRLYKTVQSDSSVMQVHREFLFARDYTCLALMMMVFLGISGFFQIPSSGTAFIYLSLLLVQFILTNQAARNHGRRFVQTVLAIKGAEI